MLFISGCTTFSNNILAGRRCDIGWKGEAKASKGNEIKAQEKYPSSVLCPEDG